MRKDRLAAALIVSLSWALLTASCIQSPTAAPEIDPDEAHGSNEPEPIEETRQPFGSKAFPFVGVLEDDGKDDGGGWQTATANLHFVHLHLGIPVHRWVCSLEVGMPLRTKLEGRISPSKAALVSAQVATEVGRVLGEGWEGPDALFCIKLVDGMQATLTGQHRGLGAKVRRL